jgi:hypothetical protein
MDMKTLLRVAAGLSFLFFFVGGLCFLSVVASSSPASDTVIPMALGFFFVGIAFFVGPLLLVAAEKFSRKDGSK